MAVLANRGCKGGVPSELMVPYMPIRITGVLKSLLYLITACLYYTVIVQPRQ